MRPDTPVQPEELELTPEITQLNFEKTSLHKLYAEGMSRDISPARWERVRTDILFEDVVADLTGHSGSAFIRCPFHGSDNTPSFRLYKGSNDAWCFGCLHEDEPTWAVSGLKRIGDLRVGEPVYDRYGAIEYVLHTESKQGELFSIETHNSRYPLLLTPDHTCFYVKQEEAVQNLPFLVKSRDKIRFWGSYKRSRKLRKKAYQTPVREGRADSICEGDYLLFPVLNYRQEDTLVNPTVRSYVKGVVPSSVKYFPVTPVSCRLYGLYLAEGSTNPNQDPRVTVWTFHIEEAKTLAGFVQTALMEIFGLKSKITLYPDKTTCEVTCCSVEFARGVSHWFGSGAANKKIPGTSLLWYVDCQNALIQGYLEGDGEKVRDRGTTVSKSLGYSLWALGIQAGKLSSLRYKPAYVDKKGVGHKETWIIEFLKRESKSRFFHEIEGHRYYWSKVLKVGVTGTSGVVVDIIVSGSESFLTKMAAVHNCPPKEQYYDHVRFVSKYLEVTRPAALRWLERKWELPALSDSSEVEDEGSPIHLTFDDLQEPYILRATKQVREFRDVELAEDYLSYYFKAMQYIKLSEAALKEGEHEDAQEARAKAATTLARVLGTKEIGRIFATKQVRR